MCGWLGGWRVEGRVEGRWRRVGGGVVGRGWRVEEGGGGWRVGWRVEGG